MKKQPNNPLHGIKLATILEKLFLEDIVDLKKKNLFFLI